MPFAVVGGLGNAWAQYRAGKIMKAGKDQYTQTIEDLIQSGEADINSLIAQEAYRNFMDTDLAQSTLRTTQDQLRENAERIRGGLASSGGTTEAAVAAQTATNRGYADVINRMVGHGQTYNDNARNRLLQARMGMMDRKGSHATNLLGFARDEAQGWSQAGSNFSKSMVDLGAAYQKDADDLASIAKLL